VSKNVLFLTPRDYIDPNARGGVQWCTQDYLKTISAAGWTADVLAFDTDQRWQSKILRRIVPRPFAYQIPPAFIKLVEERCRASDSPIVMLNNSLTMAIAPMLRERLGGRVKLVFLSHGVDSTDIINSIRLTPETLPAVMHQPRWLGQLLLAEIRQRQAIDVAVCIAETDMVFEQWLGSERTLFLPRSVSAKPLPNRTIKGRLGTVATLNHGPNLDGIRKLAEALTVKPELKLRLVGGPAETGARLQAEFKSIEYVGRLSDSELEAEAATWCGFVNPIFCQARGASTKVATALEWGIPVITSTTGSRGYYWDDTKLPRADTPEGLARICEQILQEDTNSLRQRAELVRQLAPDIATCAQLLKECVESVKLPVPSMIGQSKTSIAQLEGYLSLFRLIKQRLIKKHKAKHE
jgi:hypothetical protein